MAVSSGYSQLQGRRTAAQSFLAAALCRVLQHQLSAPWSPAGTPPPLTQFLRSCLFISFPAGGGFQRR